MKKKYVVKRRCVAQDFVFVEADDEKEAISKVHKGEGQVKSSYLEFLKPLPQTEWRAEELNQQQTHEE